MRRRENITENLPVLILQTRTITDDNTDCHGLFLLKIADLRRNIRRSYNDGLFGILGFDVGLGFFEKFEPFLDVTD